MTRVELFVLGRVRVTRGGEEVDLGTPRQRAVVAALALSEGRPVPSAVVIDRVWGERAPAGALATLHGYVASLRRALEPDRAPRAPSTVLRTTGDAYVLDITGAARDDVRLDRALASARRLLAVVTDHLRPQVSHEQREHVEAALDELDAAIASWAGEPYEDLGDDAEAAAQRARLEAQLVAAQELRAVGQLALGRHDLVLPELEAQTARFPLHERWWALRALGLARAGRQADALEALAQVRLRLSEELGVDPSPAIQDLQGAILRQEQSALEAAPGHSAGPSSGASPGAGDRPPAVGVASWATTGRMADLAALYAALEDAGRGRTGFAVVTGEAGIGKTRLTHELAVRASAAGWSVAVGRCSQDDGAPALWPWRTILHALGRDLDPREPTAAGGPFQHRADIVETITAVAARQPLLLLLDDLHWADPSSLAVLRLLAETVHDERLLVVVTWRSVPEAGRDVALVAETLARRHAVRRSLAGLAPADALRLFAEVAGSVDLGDELAGELARRTDGNPFFVVEFARLLAGDPDADPADLLSRSAPPTAVLEVVGRRVNALPDTAVTVLRSAAILGRTFGLDTLAELTAIDAEELLDLVEPAVGAGLLVESGIDEFSFAHALVRDTLTAQMSATRRARTHAVVAELLSGRPGREAEAATHWRNAGPVHVARTWRALAAAAAAARSLQADGDAVRLLDEALTLQASDTASTPRDRVGLLEELIETCRWAAVLPRLVAAVTELTALARELDDVRLEGWAATQVVRGMGWRSASYAEVHHDVVAALRHARRHVRDDDVGLRALVSIALMRELGHLHPIEERRRLRDEALDLARQSGDPRVLSDVLHEAALHQPPAPMADFLDLNAEALDLARAVGDEFGVAMRLAARVFLLSWAGDLLAFRSTLAEARRECSRSRAYFAERVLDEQELGWAAASGHAEDCERILATSARRSAVLRSVDALGRNPVAEIDLHGHHVWRGAPFDALPGIRADMEEGLPYHAFEVTALWRGGDRAGARAALDLPALHAGLDLEASFSVTVWCHIAEIAVNLGVPGLARRAYRLLLPMAGESSGADGSVFGPVDAFLALAARAEHDVATASRHADEALRLIDAWDLPPVRHWFEGLRAEHGF